MSFFKTGEIRRTWTRRIKESPYLRYLRLLQPELRLWSRETGTLPDFLILGAQRSGSTFLHDSLALTTTAVPSPLQKEVHYFDNKFYRSINWYARFFADVEERPEVQTYEASPYYLFHPAVPERVTSVLPGVKVLAVLRDPVDRAVSHYRWMRQVGLETRSAVEAFRYDAERLSLETDARYLTQFEDPLYFNFDHIHRSYLRRSLYHTQVERWLQCVAPSDLLLVRSERLFEETEAVLRRVSQFLGIEYEEGEALDQTNTNESSDDIEVSQEARAIAERELQNVEARLDALADSGAINRLALP